MHQDNYQSGAAILAPRFRTLFAGLERAHGEYRNITVDERRADGKCKGQAITKPEPVTDALWASHLEGTTGIGIIPIRDDNTSVFGAIDIDVYADLDPGQVAATVHRLRFPLVPCRSKSGGLHLYLFASAPVSSAMMQARLKQMAAALGHTNAEIFPKQANIGSERIVGHDHKGDAREVVLRRTWVCAPDAQSNRST